MDSRSSIAISNCGNVSNTKIYNHLLKELENNSNTKILKRALDNAQIKTNPNDLNQIYRFKLERTRGESLFATVENYKGFGSYIGTNFEKYLSQVERFEQSKKLISEATQYERNWIRNLTHGLYRYSWKYRNALLIKTFAVSLFVLQLSRWNEYRQYHSVARFNITQQAVTPNTSSLVTTGAITGALLLFV